MRAAGVVHLSGLGDDQGGALFGSAISLDPMLLVGGIGLLMAASFIFGGKTEPKRAARRVKRAEAKKLRQRASELERESRGWF